MRHYDPADSKDPMFAHKYEEDDDVYEPAHDFKFAANGPDDCPSCGTEGSLRVVAVEDDWWNIHCLYCEERFRRDHLVDVETHAVEPDHDPTAWAEEQQSRMEGD